jgi:hypothetical protein
MNKSSICVKNKLSTNFYYLLLFVALTIVLLLAGYSTIGPFIFGDESTYMSIARNMAFKGKFEPDHQYNPLYPFLISLAFHFFEMEGVYIWARVLNAASFAIAVFPIVFFSQEIGFAKRPSLILATLSVLLPAGAFIHVIWADPLMFPLIASGMLFAYKYFKTTYWRDAFFAGAFFGLAYLVKQYGLGIVVVLSTVTFIWAILPSSEKKNRFVGFISTVLGSAVFVAPLVLRNSLKEQANVLGYQSHFDDYWTKYQELELFDYTGQVLNALSFQISGIVFASWGLLVIFVFGLVFMWRNHPKEQVLFGVFLLLSLGAIVGVSSVHSFTYKLPFMSNGRYYGPLMPFVIILGFRWSQFSLSNEVMSSHGYRPFFFTTPGLIIIFGIIGLITWYSSPLEALIAINMIHNPDVSFLNLFLSHDNIPWGRGAGPAPVDPIWQILVALIPAVMTAIILFGFKSFPKIALAAVICMLSYQSFEAHRYVRKLGATHFNQNSIVRYALDLKENGISVGYDKESFDSSAMFFSRFWYGPHLYPNYDPLAFLGKADFVFGPSKIDDKNTVAYFDLGPGKIGGSAGSLLTFKAPANVNHQLCEKGNLKLENAYQVYDTKSSVLSGHAGNGIQRIGITVFPMNECGEEEIEFDVIVQGETLYTITAKPTHTVTLQTKVNIPSGDFEITLQPKPGKAWALKGLSLQSLDNKGPEVFVSSKALPFRILKEVGKWKAFDGRFTDMSP